MTGMTATPASVSAPILHVGQQERPANPDHSRACPGPGARFGYPESTPPVPYSNDLLKPTR